MVFRLLELFFRHRLAREAGALREDRLQDLLDLLVINAGHDIEHAVIGGEIGRGVHVVGRPQLVPHLIEQARTHAAAQDVREHLEREPPLIEHVERARRKDQVGLVGIFLMDQKRRRPLGLDRS